MPFSPKFVDLVKNATAVQGTGPVTLGSAVSGFTGFGQACSAGDQFYYCIQGVDKPAEREVGRGTMQADGKIAREPIGVGATAFTAGAKTIALIAAAEWFAGQKPGIGAAASRAALAATAAGAGATALLAEAGREGLFRFDASNLAALVSADTRQGAFIAPASDPSGASGAWRRVGCEKGLFLEHFGVVEDDATDARPAIVCAMAVAELLGRRQDIVYCSAVPIHFPHGKLYCSDTIDLFATHKFVGHNSGGLNDPATQIRFPAGKTGIRFQYFTTSGATGYDEPYHGMAAAATVTGLRLVGAWGSTLTEGEHHAFDFRTRAHVSRCVAYLWQGDGYSLDASSGGTVNQGNANLAKIEDCCAHSCRRGIHFDGPDSNACNVTGGDFSNNRHAGILDSSFIGNTVIGCHFDGNGYGGDGGHAVPSIASVCSYLGNRYCVRLGQEAGASTNAPSGTTADNTWWYYIQAGGASVVGNIIAWTSGLSWRVGGHIIAEDASAASLFLGCYGEGSHAFNQLNGRALAIGGILENGTKGPLLSVENGYVTASDLRATSAFETGGSYTYFGPTGGSVDSTVVTIRGIGGATNLKFFTYNSDGSGQSLDGTIQGLRSGNLIVSAPNTVYFRSDFGAGFGAYQGGLAVCDPAYRIGYGPGPYGGPGGTVTQATSKATGVTINKPCGQVTMAADALAAGASVTMRVTDSLVGNQDTLVVSLKAGSGTAGAYSWRTEAGAGFFDLTVTNESAGSLSEALTFNFAILQARNS